MGQLSGVGSKRRNQSKSAYTAIELTATPTQTAKGSTFGPLHLPFRTGGMDIANSGAEPTRIVTMFPTRTPELKPVVLLPCKSNATQQQFH